MERKDTWTLENDNILAKTILNHISNGSTQLKAFEEVGEVLNRTSAACGFRWNSTIRHQYETEIAEAKKNKHKSNIKTINKTNQTSNSSSSLVNQLQEIFNEMSQEIKRLKNENALKDKKIKQLENRSPNVVIEEDYKDFLKILQNARKLGILENEKGRQDAM